MVRSLAIAGLGNHQSGRLVCSLDRFLNNLKNGTFLDSVIDRRWDLETGINISK